MRRARPRRTSRAGTGSSARSACSLSHWSSGKSRTRRDVLEAGVRDDRVERAVEALERRVDDGAVALARREVAVLDVDARARSSRRRRRRSAIAAPMPRAAPVTSGRSRVVAEESSATQTGLSPPSRSTVAVIVAWKPQSASSTLSTRKVPRTVEPDRHRRREAHLVQAVVDGHAAALRAARPRTTSRAGARASGSRARSSCRTGPAAARSGSTWIHWWSPVASANASIRSCGTSIQLEGPNSVAGLRARRHRPTVRHSPPTCSRCRRRAGARARRRGARPRAPRGRARAAGRRRSCGPCRRGRRRATRRGRAPRRARGASTASCGCRRGSRRRRASRRCARARPSRRATKFGEAHLVEPVLHRRRVLDVEEAVAAVRRRRSRPTAPSPAARTSRR